MHKQLRSELQSGGTALHSWMIAGPTGSRATQTSVAVLQVSPFGPHAVTASANALWHVPPTQSTLALPPPESVEPSSARVGRLRQSHAGNPRCVSRAAVFTARRSVCSARTCLQHERTADDAKQYRESCCSVAKGTKAILNPCGDGPNRLGRRSALRGTAQPAPWGLSGGGRHEIRSRNHRPRSHHGREVTSSVSNCSSSASLASSRVFWASMKRHTISIRVGMIDSC